MEKATHVTGYHVWVSVEAVLGTEWEAELDHIQVANDLYTKHRWLPFDDLLSILNDLGIPQEEIDKVEEAMHKLHEEVEANRVSTPKQEDE